MVDATAHAAALLTQAIAAFPTGAGEADLSVYRDPRAQQPEVTLGVSSYGA